MKWLFFAFFGLFAGISAKVMNMITDLEVTTPWLEVGYVDLDDSAWTTISSNVTTFVNPVVFLSLPEIAGNTFSDGMAVSARLRSVKMVNNIVTFQARLYQPNDTYCLKTWWTPKYINPHILVSYTIAERGAYNISGNAFFIGAANITRPEKSTFASANHQKIEYPYGCDSPTSACAFPDGSTVGGITQVQTLMNNRFLLVRGSFFALRFARYLLVPHDSVDENYQVMTTPETMAFMVFRPSNGISCLEGLGFEAKVIPGVSENAITQTFIYNYQYAPGVYGQINTVLGQDSVGLRTFNKDTTSTRLITQEDQCFDEETAHTNLETVALIIMGHIIPNVQSQECKVKFTPPTIPDPTVSPTLAPTSFPSRSPTFKPSSLPTRAPTASPTAKPTVAPSATPTVAPTAAPTSVPTLCPTCNPTAIPTVRPSALPTVMPTQSPTSAPTAQPTAFPSSAPSPFPTQVPTFDPTQEPTFSPTQAPTSPPTAIPSSSPTVTPTVAPTAFPTAVPSTSPTVAPTVAPTAFPTAVPSSSPTVAPTAAPSSSPTVAPTVAPTAFPTAVPSSSPTVAPTFEPTSSPSHNPTMHPTGGPTFSPTVHPTSKPTCTPTSAPTSSPSVAPTSKPTFAPTAIPTAKPTSAPTATPTITPTRTPTAVPTALPSLAPTEAPTFAPSANPTVAPTAGPTATPTMAPTANPTPVPTSAPSAQPTLAPTGIPTVQPTASPTSLPTVAPTSGPTIYPTLAPTMIPTLQPTRYPTGGPTFSPTVIPTFSPTEHPTASPTVSPTTAPTSVPTLNPTALPTVAPSMHPTASPTTPPSNAPTHTPTYLPSSSPTIAPTLHPTGGPTTSPTVAPTLTPTVAPTNMPTLAPTSAPTTAPTFAPSAFPSILPTATPSFLPSLTPTAEPTLEPTPGPTLAPTVLPACIAGDKMIKVRYDLQSPGRVYCAAFEGSVLPSLNTVKQIAYQEASNFTYTMSSASGYMEVQNLKGGLDYHVLCYQELFAGEATTALSEVYANACHVQTSCCKEVYLTKTRRVYAEGDVSEPIVIRVTSLPSDEVTVVPIIQHSSDCDVHSATPMNDVAPSNFIFTESSDATTALMLFEMEESGCYYVSMNMTGHSADEYSFRDDVITIVALNATSAPDLRLSRVYVDQTGSSFLAEFSSATDRGAAFGLDPYAPFQCSLVASFAGAEESTCMFIDDETLEITPPSGYAHDIPTIGQNISFIGDWLKGKCVQEICPEYPYMHPDIGTLQPPLRHVLVDAVIVGATEPSDSLTLDITTSTGHGNRPFLINWSVLNATTGDSFPALESYFNGLLWQNCPYGAPTCNVVPRDQFPRDGKYTLVLRLQNYLGEFDIATITVSIHDGALSHYLLNNYHLLLRKYEQTFQFDTDGLYASLAPDDTAIDVRWNLQSFNGTIINTTNLSRDKRRFRTASYTFETFHAYTISSTVTLVPSGFTATAQKTVYIIQGHLHIIIQNGILQTHYDNSIFHLNASTSYDDDLYATSRIRYTWSCVRSVPLSSSCPGFDELNAEHQSIITFDSSLMTSDSTYVFQLHITDGIREDSQVVVVNIVSTTVPTLRLRESSLGDSQFMLNSRFDYSVSPFDVTWHRNEDELTYNRFQPRTIPFPYRVQTGSASGMYTFLLSMRPLRCSDGNNEVTECATAVFAVDYEANHPPRAGSLSSWPASGNTDTLFSLYAAGWTDADLPLTYKYFQYSDHHNEYLLIQQASPETHATAVLTESSRDGNILLRVFDALDNYAEVFLTVPVSASLPSLAMHNITSSLIVGNFDRVLQYVQVHQDSMHHVCGSDSHSCSNFTSYDIHLIVDSWEGVDIDFDVLETTTWLVNGSVSLIDTINREAWNQALWDSAIDCGTMVMDSVQERGFKASTEFRLVERLVVSNEYLLFMYFDYQLSGGRRLQAVPGNIDGIHANTLKLVNTIYSALVLGENYQLTRNFYSINIAKNRPDSNYLPASEDDWLVMNRTSAFSNDTIAYGYTAVKFNSESSNCTDNTKGCDALTDTIISAVYIVSSIDMPSLPVYEVAVLAHNIDGVLEPLTPLSFVDTCDGNTNVTFICHANETWGRPYSEATLQCNDRVGTWEYTCPEYSIKPKCLADEKCSVVSESETELVCQCEVDYVSTAANSVLDIPFEGFTTYKRENSNNALYEKRLVNPASKVFTLDSSALSSSDTNSLALQISILLPVLIFLCCCFLFLLFLCMTRVHTKDEWLKINNKPTGLRDYVNMYRNENDTLDMEDVKLYMQKSVKSGDPLEPEYALALPSYADYFDSLKYGSSGDTGFVDKRHPRKQLTIITDPLVAAYNDALPLYGAQYNEAIHDKEVDDDDDDDDDDATADETEYLSMHTNMSVLPPLPIQKTKDGHSPQNPLRTVLVPQIAMRSIPQPHMGDEVTPRSRAYVDGFLFTARTADSSDSADESEILQLHHLDSHRPPRLTPRTRDTQSRSCELFFAPEERR